MNNFYQYLKEKYPEILSPENLVKFVFHELDQYANIQEDFQLPEIGTFSKSACFVRHLQFDALPYVEKPKIDLNYVFSNKSIITQLTLGQEIVIEKEPEEEIVADDNDFSLDDFF